MALPAPACLPAKPPDEATASGGGSRRDTAPRRTKSRGNQIREDAASFIGANENSDDLGDDAQRAVGRIAEDIGWKSGFSGSRTIRPFRVP